MKIQQCFFLMMFCCTAAAAEAPAIAAERVAFKQYTLGSDFDAARSSKRLRCRDGATPIYDVSCTLTTPDESANEPPITIAGAVATRMSISGYGGSIGRIGVGFSPGKFNDVAAALTEKYGAADRQEEVIKTRNGDEYVNVKLKWQIGADVIEANKYAAKVTESEVVYFDPADLLEYARRKDEEAKAKSADL